MTIDDHNDDPHQAQPVSKTQTKKRMLALQALGESLIDLPKKMYAQVPLPDELRRAVDAARDMTKRGALHRQRQFIGRLMRDVDPDPIRAALDRLQNKDRQAARQFHRVEALRNRLVEERNDELVTQICADFPHADAQSLRQKVRAARREADSGRPAGAGRALFRYLDGLLLDAPAPDA